MKRSWMVIGSAVLSLAGVVMIPAASGARGQVPVFVEQRLNVPVETSAGARAVSPDGLVIAFTGNCNCLGLWDRDRRERRVLVDVDPERRGFPSYVAWSPDGRHLAFGWEPNPALGGVTSVRREVRIIPAAGGTPVTVLRGEDREQLHVFNWSPDTREVLIALWRSDPDRQWRGDLVAVSVADGRRRLLANVGPVPAGGTIRQAAFSADGSSVAYDIRRADTGRRVVIVVSSAGESLIADATADVGLMAWTAKSRLLVSHSRGDQTDVVVTSVAGARDETVVARNVGRVDPLGLATGGRLFVRKEVVSADVYVAVVDSTSGRATAAPTPLDRPRGAPARRFEAAWSRDGSRIAYASGEDLVVQTIATGDLRTYPVAIVGLEQLTWQPDGLALVANGSDAQNRAGLHRIDLQNGSVTYLGERGGSVFAADGKGLFVIGRGAVRGPMAIRRLDLATGVESPINWQGRGYPVAMTPDGRFFIIFTGPAGARGTISRGGLDGSGRVVLVEGVAGLSNSIELSADGQYVYFYTGGPDGDAFRVPVDGGGRVATGIRLPFVHRLSLHPDGRRIALSSRMTESTVVAWSGIH